MLRADISGSINSLSTPYLEIQSWQIEPSVLRARDDETLRSLSPGFQAVHDDCGFDAHLVDILHRVNVVTRIMNTIRPFKSDVIPVQLRQTLRSIQYDLLLLCVENQDDDHNIISSIPSSSPSASTSTSASTSANSEGSSHGHHQQLQLNLTRACHFGILLYSGAIQNELWYPSMSKPLLSHLESSLSQLQLQLQIGPIATATKHIALRKLHLWLVILAGSLALEPNDKVRLVRLTSHAVAALSPSLSLSRWEDAKKLLETFAWVGKLQDQAGRKLWEEAVGGGRCGMRLLEK